MIQSGPFSTNIRKLLTEEEDDTPTVIPESEVLKREMIEKATRGLYLSLHNYRKLPLRKRVMERYLVSVECANGNEQHKIVLPLDADRRIIAACCPCQKNPAVKAAGLLGATTCLLVRDALMKYALKIGTGDFSLGDFVNEEVIDMVNKSRDKVSSLRKFRRTHGNPAKFKFGKPRWEGTIPRRIDNTRHLIHKWIFKPLVEMKMIGAFEFKDTGPAGQDLLFEVTLVGGVHWEGRGTASLHFIHRADLGWKIEPAIQQHRALAHDASIWANAHMLLLLKKPYLIHSLVRGRRRP